MASIYYIPSGPKNLIELFPAIDWNRIDDYYLEILAGNTVIGTTTHFNMGCCCADDGVRIIFTNSLGATADGINFNKPTILHETEFDTYQKSLAYPLVKTDTGTEKFNIRSNDTYECTSNCYEEDDMIWITELFSSSKAYMQIKGTQLQTDDHIPIIILSKQFQKQKNQNEYSYLVTVQFQLANGYMNLRN